VKSLTEHELITICGGGELSKMNHDFNKGFAISHVDGAIGKLQACASGGTCEPLNAMQSGALAASFGKTPGELADSICLGTTNIPLPRID
jgi:hypothetical protein